MKVQRQVELLAEVESLLKELGQVAVARLHSGDAAETGIPRSAFGVVLSFLRLRRPSRAELLEFLRRSPSLDAQNAQNDTNPAAQQTALSRLLLDWLAERPELSDEELRFVWGWVHGRLIRRVEPVAPRRQETKKGSPRVQQPVVPAGVPEPARMNNQMALLLARFKKDS